MATKRKIDRESQAYQFGILADSLERQITSINGNRPTATVYVLLRHVSGSGMRRVIDFMVLDKDGNMRPLTLVGADLYRYDYDRNGYLVHGCGMDMGFALTDSIMHQLRKWCEAEGYNLTLAADLKDWQGIVRHEFL